MSSFVLAANLAAATCEVGGRPGTTLLFPYFEVDLTRPDGLTTLVSINSASPLPELTHVTVWSDWGVPVLSFDVLLRPMAVQTLNLRDVLRGVLPATDGAEVVQFSNCVNLPPRYKPLDERQIDGIALRLTGLGGNWCHGAHYGDDHARGYVTVDTVNTCSGLTVNLYGESSPADPAYYSRLTVSDVLWGDLLYVDPGGNSAQGVEAVAIRSKSTVSGGTFYGHYAQGADGRDRRSPLPSYWSTRFLNGGGFDGGTDVIVFRSGVAAGGAACGSNPFWYPIRAKELTVRQESGWVVRRLVEHGAFPIATQRVRVSDLLGDQTASTPFGRLDLDLERPFGGGGAWVIPIMTAAERFSVALNAQPFGGCAP